MAWEQVKRRATDFLDRITGVSGAYSNTYTYDTIGNITSMNGSPYTYGAKPHAVTAVGSTSYDYDANGNMITRGDQTLTWDVENRLVGVAGGVSMSAVYDGDGNRVKKGDGGSVVLYVNRYYEKNLTTGVVTTHYYLGDREIAYRKGTAIEYISQDLLGSTSVTTDASSNVVATVAYFPFGATRTSSGTPNTDKLFTGQRLDETGLYYYNARYYDATIGRFISADSRVQTPLVPQCLNRYSYCLNNPLVFVDPTGHQVEIAIGATALAVGLVIALVAQADNMAHQGNQAGAGQWINWGINYVEQRVKSYWDTAYRSLKTLYHSLTDWYTGWKPAVDWQRLAITRAAQATLADVDENAYTRTRVNFRARLNCVYLLQAARSGWYPSYTYGFWGRAWLTAGAVWKIGRTSQFDPHSPILSQARYSRTYLNTTGPGLLYFPVYFGPWSSCVALEYYLLEDHFNKHHHLPPGNKVFA